MSETTGQDQQQSMRRVAMTSLAGTSIEWYDFFLYGTAAAVIFPKAFFPQDLPTMVLLIISFSTCLLYTSPSPRDLSTSRMPSSA